MDIQHIQTEKGGKFYIEEPDESVTELVYKISGPQKMIIEHTEVSERQEGKGIGRMLVAEAINYARQHNMKVLPLCPFANAIMKKSTEYQDILAPYGVEND